MKRVYNPARSLEEHGMYKTILKREGRQVLSPFTMIKIKRIYYDASRERMVTYVYPFALDPNDEHCREYFVVWEGVEH